MLINENTTITGEKVVLVPYRKEHVPLYHEWMKSPFLQEMTESEPLTIEEEYEMQQTWRNDADKCTFIVLDRAHPDTPGIPGPHGGAMAGDVNLFLNDPDEPDIAEIEVMIAEERSRSRGLAKEALRLMMRYALESLGVKRFRAKILDHNTPSLALFRGLGFQDEKIVAVFNEVHLLMGEEGARRLAAGGEGKYEVGTYEAR